MNRDRPMAARLKIGFRRFNALRAMFKFPPSAKPNEIDFFMKHWWRMTSPQEYLKASFYFACWTTALLQQLQFVFFFFVDENYYHYQKSGEVK